MQRAVTMHDAHAVSAAGWHLVPERSTCLQVASILAAFNWLFTPDFTKIDSGCIPGSPRTMVVSFQ